MFTKIIFPNLDFAYGEKFFYKKFMTYPDLSREEEIFLFKEYNNSTNLEEKDLIKEEILNANYKYVVLIALKHSGNLWENISRGMFGLLKAFKKYDLNRGASFKTFACSKINFSIIRFDESKEDREKKNFIKKRITFYSIEDLYENNDNNAIHHYISDANTPDIIYGKKELTEIFYKIFSFFEEDIYKFIIKERILAQKKLTRKTIAEQFSVDISSIVRIENKCLKHLTNTVQDRYPFLKDYISDN